MVSLRFTYYRKQEEPTGKETTTTDYFGSSNKPKRSELAKSRPASSSTKTNGASSKATETPKAKSNGTIIASQSNQAVESGRKPKVLDDFQDLDNDDDIFTADYKKAGKVRGDDYEEGTDAEDDAPVLPKRGARPKGRQSKIKNNKDDYEPNDDVKMKDADPEDDFVVPDDEEIIVMDKQEAKKPSRKRKSDELDEDEEKPKKSRSKKTTTPTMKSPAKKRTKKNDEPENLEMRAIYDSIPTIKAPTPPPKGADAKFNFKANASHTAPPPGAGSKEIPIGNENCLAGLSFVLTGVNPSLGRDEGVALIKRYGGKVMTSASKNTSYVVLGADAGPKKLQIIRDHNLKAIDEDGLFELIRRLPPNGGSGKAAEKYAEKQEKEEQKVKEMAAQMEKEDRRVGGAGGAGASKSAASVKGKSPVVEDRLWTVKYAPTQMNQICGNKGQVEKLQRWLKAFPKNLRTKFKLAGADGSGTYRAVIISGPPGIGKTTAAHLAAKLEGYDVVEMNASDTRSKKLLEDGLRGVLGTTSLLGYFAGDGRKVESSKKKLVLIMDEVDGMSAGDRGGVGALASTCKKTQVPMILICNDRKLPKMKPFDYATYDLPFRKPSTEMIRARMMTIAYREHLKIPTNVVDALIEGSGADIRQVVNMISSAKLDQEAMDFDRGKAMSKQWEKHVILKPWDITAKILGGGLFASSSKATLNDKIELYFNDHEFSHLMLQENYLGTNPMLSTSYEGREKKLKVLELASKAADSISDGDLVDRMIHGSQQQWSLMPTHAVFSFVRPASFISGSMAGNQTRFTSWLGKNSAQGKLTRMVKEIHGHMRLRSSGDRHEIRQQYIPVLWQQLVNRLQVEGKEVVPTIIDLMDSYFLTRDDFDAIQELGVGPMDMERVKIESQTKATFTRLYNQQSHPLPFMKASSVVQPKKTTKDKPDLEEALEESDEGDVDEAPDNDEETDLSKDKYIKAPKKKAAAAAGKGKGKGRGEEA